MLLTKRSLTQLGALVVGLLWTGSAFAQGANTGALTGRVTDASTGQAVPGVTVVAQGPQGEQAELTDDTGTYTITGLVPGQYVVRYYFANVKVERPNVTVYADKKIQINVPLQTKSATAETYTITEKAPTIDIGSTKIGTTITKDFTNNVPVGRNFDTVAEVAPGAQMDQMGVSFAGATSAENNYVIDGINVTSVHMSQAAGSSLGSALNLDFVQEVEVITGGYNAEYGRATGGVVNVITKSGSNEFHGDAAFYYDPYTLRGTAPIISFPGQSLSTRRENDPSDYRLDFFADLGGPIIKDRLWFYVGFEPIFTKATFRRIVSRLVDNCTQSDAAQRGACMGAPDGIQDYINGEYASQEIYHSTVERSESALQWTGKINLLVTPDHTLEVAYYGSPDTVEAPRAFGSPLSVRQLGGAQDAVAHWVSKLFDKKWQLEASFSYHRERSFHEQLDPVENQAAITWSTDPVINSNSPTLSGCKDYSQTPPKPIPCTDRSGGTSPSLSWFTQYEGPNADIIRQQCDNVMFAPGGGSVTPTDPAARLRVLCPVPGYTTGGSGGWENLIADRIGTRLAGTNFVRAAGHHQFMYGWDFERNGFQDVRLWTGAGALNVLQSGGSKFVLQRGWGYFKDQGLGLGGGMCPGPDCNIVPYPMKRNPNYSPVIDPMTMLPVPDYSQCIKSEDIPGDASWFCADTHTMNHALFARDSWSVLPNLTLNLGLRWERQAISGVTDFENAVIGDSPIVLNNNWSPRVGVIYDPTNEGKAKLYGSFARFYESIPLDINNRSFGQEGYLSNVFRYRDSTTNPMHSTCRRSLLEMNTFSCDLARPRLFGGEKALIEPDISGMFTDEIVVGGEYEIIEDLAVGAYYTHRQLGTIIEDGSVDNATTYYITNPGERVSNSQIKTLQDRSAKAAALGMQAAQDGNMILASNYMNFSSELATFADNLPYFGNFEKPQRDYNAFTLTARKRFSKNWLAQASYTYARTIGNYPGIYNPYIDQRDPNISQMYDLPDLLTNRVGPLPTDIPHQLKLDGYYTWRLGGDNAVVTGTSFRAQSGAPKDVLGVNQIYAPFPENFLLPAGSGGRNDFVTSWDIQLAYVRQLPRHMSLQLFFAAYNLLNTATALSRDPIYSNDYTAPVVNGRMSDLNHLKTVDGNVAKPNASFDRPTSYQLPIFTRFGARFTF